MGVISYVGCKSCGVCRDLGKFYRVGEVATVEEARQLVADQTEASIYQMVLLASFMKEHQDHECVFFNDCGLCPEELGFLTEQDWFFGGG